MLKPEQVDHINLVNWFHHNYPELQDDFHHFANERKCTWNQGTTLKKMGVKRGVFDFFLAIPIEDKSGFWLELKVGKNKPTKEQIEFGARKILRGYSAVIVWGFEAAKHAFDVYLKEYKKPQL